MSTRTKNHERIVPLIHRLPTGTYYDVCDGELNMQAATQAELHKITRCFPGTTWKKKYDNGLKWWEYVSEFDGTKLEIYACHEAPKSCKAITETQTVVKEIPVAFETKEVEETVIVGWDCGGAE